jgi:hypothetical protein
MKSSFLAVLPVLHAPPESAAMSINKMQWCPFILQGNNWTAISPDASAGTGKKNGIVPDRFSRTHGHYCIYSGLINLLLYNWK